MVTGAMRNPTIAGADGPGNLLAAVQAAASTHLTGVGCVVVMADEIHAAKHVHKMNSTSLGAFASPDTGPIGRVVEGDPYLMTRSITAPTYPIPTRGVRIGLITACLGDDAELLRRLHSGFDGLVIAGFGVGQCPQRSLTRSLSLPLECRSCSRREPVPARSCAAPTVSPALSVISRTED